MNEILLDKMRVPFSRTTGGDLDFTREGAHSVARIVHSADATGRAIETTLLRAARGEERPLWTEATAIDLLTMRHHSNDVVQRYQLQDPCLGAYVLDAKGEVHTVLADFTVLATGGVGRLFLHTSNTQHAIGDGLAMADRPGAAALNLEYVQFHPTTLYHPDADRFLISEALRGEGGVLVNRSGEPFMQRYDAQRKDLAPRDVVTRAIVEEMTARGEPCVYLDLAHHYKPHAGQSIRERFPTIAAKCESSGSTSRRSRSPSCPRRTTSAAACSWTWRERPRSGTSMRSARQLHGRARGEPAGLDVAPRRARVGIRRGALDHPRLKTKQGFTAKAFRSIPDWRPPGRTANEDPALIQQDWATIRNTMWNYVGIVRTTERLGRAVADIRDMEKRIHRFYQETKVSKAIVDLFHGVHASHLIAQAALKNPVSRGCHYRKS